MWSFIHSRGCICMPATCGKAQPDSATDWSIFYRNIHQTAFYDLNRIVPSIVPSRRSDFLKTA
eukprot:1110464-Pelagomonas_calceolata.AAC.1